MWKQCITGSYDFVNENDNTIIQIYRVKSEKNKNWNGQVMHPNGVHATLINNEDFNIFIFKLLRRSIFSGLGYRYKKVGVNPNLDNLPIFESDIYKEYFKNK